MHRGLFSILSYFCRIYSHGRIWNPPLRSADPVAFCPPPTSAGWGHPALHPTEKGERRAASPLAAVPASGHSKPSVQSPHPHPADKSLPCQREVPSLRGGGIPARLRVRQCTRHSPSESLRPPAASTCSPSGATRHLPPARGSLSLTREAFLLQP